MKRSTALGAMIALVLTPMLGEAQEWRGPAAHVGTSTRVLLIGTRPEDEDNALIAWLSLGRHVETAYLSLTRGESGVNVFGSEREAPLAAVRTAELLAERQRDRARQYFTRAFDFGPTAADSIVNVAWPRDSLLKDVVSVIRAFRPHVVISVTAETGESDATRRLAAQLAAEAFAVSADTVRMPAATTARLPAWTVWRLFTRVESASSAQSRHVMLDVGEIDRTAGRSYAEIGAEIRRLQRTQPVSPAPPLGPLLRVLRLDSTRIGGDAPLFGSADTTLARVRGSLAPEALAQLDTLRSELDALATLASSGTADSLAAQFALLTRRTSDVRLALDCPDVAGVPACPGASGDLAVVLTTIRERATRAMLASAGLVIDGVVDRQLVAAGDSVTAVTTIYNGGGSPVIVRRLAPFVDGRLSVALRDTSVIVPPGSVARWSTSLRVLAPSYPWWQVNGLVEGTRLHAVRGTRAMPVPPQLIGGEDRLATSGLEVTLAIGGVEVPVIVRPLTYRTVTALRGETRSPLLGVPETSVLLERVAEYERAGVPIDRLFRVYVSSARSRADTLALTLELPPGLSTDSATRTVALPPFGAQNVFFRLRGTLGPGSHLLAASARSVSAVLPDAASTVFRSAAGEFRHGVVLHEYPHIPSQKFMRSAEDRIEAVDLRVPPPLRVAYVRGTEDLRSPLAQLQVAVQVLDRALLPVVDLSRFTTVLIGTGALTGDEGLATPALRRFLESGGTVVILPGGGEVARSGLLPYPIGFDGAPGRVGDAAAAVRVEAGSSLFSWPNSITTKDFEHWTGDRARGVPTTFDQRYLAPLSVADAEQKTVQGTVLAARVGRGMVVYTALSLDQQLDGAIPGAARLMINLLTAGMRPTPAQ